MKNTVNALIIGVAIIIGAAIIGQAISTGFSDLSSTLYLRLTK